MLTVVIPAASTRLTTIAAAAAETGAPPAGPDFDRLAGIVDRASAAVVSFCGQPFGLATYSETPAFRRPGRSLFLSRVPVVSLVSVSHDDAVVDVTRCRFDTLIGEFAFPRGSWLSWPLIRYRAGYALPGDPDPTSPAQRLPADVEAACLEMAKSLYFSGGSEARDPRIRSDAVEGVGSTSYLDPQASAGALPATAAALLAPYVFHQR